jgi:hypothetical protein
MSIRFAIDPPDEDRDELVNPEHEAETIRQQAWDLFVAEVRDWAAAIKYGNVLEDLMHAYCALQMNPDYMPYGPGRFAYHAMLFSREHGWPSTLRAIAQAMQADEQAKQEAMDRR